MIIPILIGAGIGIYFLTNGASGRTTGSVTTPTLNNPSMPTAPIREPERVYTPAFINVINTVRRKRPDAKRKLLQITHIVLHHTAWDKDATPDDIAKIHIEQNGWRSIGYHFLISKDGTIYQNKNYTDIGTHVRDFNTPSIGISCNGNFDNYEPTPEQVNSVRWLLRKIQSDLGNKIIIGHKEAPGAATACPGKFYPLAEMKSVGMAGLGANSNYLRHFLGYEYEGKLVFMEELCGIPSQHITGILSKIIELSQSDTFTANQYKKFIGYEFDLGELIIGDFRIFVTQISANSYEMLHIFRKKTNETPEKEINIAISRYKKKYG